MTNQKVKGHLLALATIFIWGTTFISTKVLLRDFTPVEILFVRFGIGFLALLFVYPHRLIIKEKKKEFLFAAAGFCGITLYFLLENIALTYSMASIIGVIVSVAPFFTAILAHRFLNGEKLKLNFFLGFLAAIAGIVLLSFNKSTELHMNFLGTILAVLAAVVWAVYSILIRKISKFGYNTIQITRRIFMYGILFMIPALFLFHFKIRIKQFSDPVVIFNILFLGLGASALCFVTWNIAVKILGAVKTSVYIYLIPVITVITSVIILKDRINWAIVTGTILTMVGLLISENRFDILTHRHKKTEGELT